MNKTSINLFWQYNISIISQFLKRYSLTSMMLKGVYESESFIDDYVPQIELQKPEITVLEELKDELPHFRMLDIGVGLGRTTKYFAPLVTEYIGIDYSINMIKVCRQRYPHLRLEVADARNLSFLENNYFDFVLFSFNGIDNVQHEERMQILREIHRILKKDGFFCFSTLNLNAWLLKPMFRFSKSPRLLYRSTYNFLLNNSVWRSLRAKTKEKHTMIYFTYKDFLLRNYFITPYEQLRQLQDTGFSDTRAYDLNSGKVVSNPENMRDYYIYFRTKAK
jgi:ubiquinone/menaquinone biosynthesis C-methylase UbiE